MQQVPERALLAIRDACCSSGRLEMEKRRFHKRRGWRVRHGGADGDLSPGFGSSRGEESAATGYAEQQRSRAFFSQGMSQRGAYANKRQ
jgi:hypothetical protein